MNVNQNNIDDIGDYVEGLTCLTSFEGMKNNISIISTKLGMLCSLNHLSIPVNQIKVSTSIFLMFQTMYKSMLF